MGITYLLLEQQMATERKDMLPSNTECPYFIRPLRTHDMRNDPSHVMYFISVFSLSPGPWADGRRLPKGDHQ